MNKRVKIVIKGRNGICRTSIRGNARVAAKLLVKALADVYQESKRDNSTAEGFADEVAERLKWFIYAAEE